VRRPDAAPSAPGPRLSRHRGFRVLFVGATLSRLSTEMNSVAVVLFVLAVTHSAQVAGLTVAASTLPTVVTGPLVGAWLDRSRHPGALHPRAARRSRIAVASAPAALRHGRDDGESAVVRPDRRRVPAAGARPWLRTGSRGAAVLGLRHRRFDRIGQLRPRGIA